MEYEKMLDRLYALLPESTKAKERLEMPAPESDVQGNKTTVRNFSQILKAIRRDEQHVLKYVTKETATSASVDGGRLVLNSRFMPRQIAELFSGYIGQYVLCHECKKPDTKIIDQHGVKMLKCEACGAISALRKV